MLNFNVDDCLDNKCKQTIILKSYLAAHHGECFTRTSLSISKHTYIVTFLCRLNNFSSQIAENLYTKNYYLQNNSTVITTKSGTISNFFTTISTFHF